MFTLTYDEGRALLAMSQERMQNDAKFFALVNTLDQLLAEDHCTPSDVLQAAIVLRKVSEDRKIIKAMEKDPAPVQMPDGSVMEFRKKEGDV